MRRHRALSSSIAINEMCYWSLTCQLGVLELELLQVVVLLVDVLHSVLNGVQER